MGKGERLYTIEDLENLLDNIPYEIWIKDENGTYAYMNKYGAERMGLSKEDIMGEDDYAFRPASIADKCKYTDKQVWDKNDGIFHEERAYVDNSEMWYEVYKFPMKSGNRLLLGGIGQEVSDNRNIKLEFEKLMLDTFDKNSLRNDAVVVYNEFLNKILNAIEEISKCTSINLFLYDENEETFNYYLSASKGKKIFKNNAVIKANKEIIHKLEEDRLNREVNRLLQVELSKCYEEIKEDIKTTSYNIQPIKFADKLIGILYIYDEEKNLNKYIDEFFIKEICGILSNVLTNIEITKGIEGFEQEIIEKDRERLEEIVGLEVIKESFLANMSHEFRTPINIILTTADLLLDDLEKNRDVDKERYNKYLNVLKQNSYRLLRLANNILDTSKIYSGFYKLKIGNYNIVSIIEDIVLSTVEYIDGNNRNLIFDTEEEEIILACDPDKIENIMLNLISNSLKFTDDNGNIEVKLSLDKERKNVFIHVKNDGPPISKEDARKIFGRFVQNEDLLTRGSEGSGIGLFLVKSLVEMHEGEIWVNTNEKEGAEFIFYLPIRMVEEKEIEKPSSSSLESKIQKCNIEFSDVYSI